MKISPTTLFSIGAFIACMASPTASAAGGTRIWELAGFNEFDRGEADGTQLSSLGEVSLGKRPRKLDFEDVALVWCAARDRAGRIYLGTGYDGKIYRVDGSKVVEIATTGQLVITALAFDEKGDLYVGGLPEPVISKIKAPAKIAPKKPVEAAKWVTLPGDTKHIWAMTFDTNGRTLYVGTGPEGKLFAVGRDKKAAVYLDTEEEHILSLLYREPGRILAGTSPGALLLEVSGPGRASALADFNATEVKVIAAMGDDLFAAVNKFKKPPSVPRKSSKTDKESSSKGGISSRSKKKSSRDTGDGEIYRFDAEGNIERIWEKKKGHVVSLALAKGWVVYAGLGTEGKVISVDKDRLARVELDLDERQVMALLAAAELDFAATGDAGAAYSIARARPADAVYLTPPLDAKRISRWGRLGWFASGKLKVQTRSGNTAIPDVNWSDWSGPVALGSELKSPAARYLQLRFSWAGDKGATLVSAELTYRPQNQRAVITEFDPDSPFPVRKKKAKKGEGEVSTRTIVARPTSKNGAELDLSWKVSNPDQDTLRYHLFYRAMGRKKWRPITREDKVHKSKRFTWETISVPEGRYQIRLVADDSPSNDPREVLEDQFISVPVLVDNHQPSVKKISHKTRQIRGEAVDSFSAVSGLEFSIDNGPWMPISSKDGILDERKEAFEFPLPDDLDSGPHSVAVRAWDRAGNIGIAELHIELP